MVILLPRAGYSKTAQASVSCFADSPLAALLESNGRERKKTRTVRFARRFRLGGRDAYGPCGSQDDAGTLRGRERRGRSRKPAARAPRRSVRKEEGGYDLRFRGPGRQDGQEDRPLSQGSLYRRERRHEGNRRLGHGQQGLPERGFRGTS